jgi:hypothetical protein
MSFRHLPTLCPAGQTEGVTVNPLPYWPRCGNKRQLVKHLHSRQLAQPLSLVLLIFGFGLNAQGQFTISNQEPITTAVIP